jgi:hypothetical protein
MDEQAAARAIEAALFGKGMLLHPLVSVLVTAYAGQDVSVLGEVARPGVYPYTFHHRLLDLISAASGLSPNAGRLVNVFHQGDSKTPHAGCARSRAEPIQPRTTIPSSARRHRAGEPRRTRLCGRRRHPPRRIWGRSSAGPHGGTGAVAGLGPSQNANAKAILIRESKGGRTMISLNLKRMLRGQDPDQPCRIATSSTSPTPWPGTSPTAPWSLPFNPPSASPSTPRWSIRKVLTVMRRIAWVLLLLFAFAVPWEYSLDLGEPLGKWPASLDLLFCSLPFPAVFKPAACALRVHIAVFLRWRSYLWFCCSYFWTIDPGATLKGCVPTFRR